MENTPSKTNVPFSVHHELKIDAVETISNSEMENIIQSISFHIESEFNGVRHYGESLVYKLDPPSESDFKKFDSFTKEEIVNMLEEKMLPEIITSKTYLNSKYYKSTEIYTSDNLPWN